MRAGGCPAGAACSLREHAEVPVPPVPWRGFSGISIASKHSNKESKLNGLVNCSFILPQYKFPNNVPNESPQTIYKQKIRSIQQNVPVCGTPQDATKDATV